jgi:Predicted metal-binding integral membrane protein (DUF2182)
MSGCNNIGGLELLLSGDATLIWGLLFSAWGTVFIAVLTGNGNWLHADALTAHPYWGIGANGRGTRAAWELGFRHGLYCLGCCWALMLVMFSVGVAHLAGMLVLTAVMAIEKTSRWGRTLVPVFGVILLSLGRPYPGLGRRSDSNSHQFPLLRLVSLDMN